jgi:alpha-L-fucosidase
LPDHDVVNAEEFLLAERVRVDGELARWEACQTINGRWGDVPNAKSRSVGRVIEMFIDAVSKDGNFLLNVGPTARGEFPADSSHLLEQIGEWLFRHETSVIGAGPSDFTAPTDTRYTQRGNRLYLHLFTWPLLEVRLPGLASRVKFARLLHDHTEVQFLEPQAGKSLVRTYEPGDLVLRLPDERPAIVVPVVEIFLTD